MVATDLYKIAATNYSNTASSVATLQTIGLNSNQRTDRTTVGTETGLRLAFQADRAVEIQWIATCANKRFHIDLTQSKYSNLRGFRPRTDLCLKEK